MIRGKQKIHIFDSFVNHEIKSALASTKAYIELLKRGVVKGNKQKTQDYIEKTEKQLEKVITLFTTAMDAERLVKQTTTLHKELVKIPDYFTGLAERYDVLIIKNSLDLLINMDPLLITKVFEQLIVNAQTYAKDDKKIIIQTEKKDNNTVCIYFQDFGPGITYEVQQTLFQPFSKSEESSGLGLGLYIAKTIIQIHGGELTLKTSNTTGSTFCITLPIK